jgi:hypothetical protein
MQLDYGTTTSYPISQFYAHPQFYSYTKVFRDSYFYTNASS